MTNENRTTPLPPIREEASTRAVEALMSNYRDAQQAFLELVDNAVDNREEGSPLRVSIRVSKNELSVANYGGRGLDYDGLANFFVWGYSAKTAREIGFYGVGGKAAMGYLGRSMEVVCSAKGSKEEVRVSDPSWESREEGQWKTFIPEVRSATTEEGYFRVKIGNVKKDVSAAALGVKLADIYRPLILDKSVQIDINGKPIDPLEIKYKEDDEALRPEVYQVQTRSGDLVILRVGVMEEGQKIKPGLRCYYRGRLMEDEQFFDQPKPAQLPQASKLLGEAFLDHVPVTANKSSFDHGSAQWKDASIQLNKALGPWIEKIAQLRPERQSEVENWEKEMAKTTKKMLEHVFARSSLVARDLLPGESLARRGGGRRSDETIVPPTGEPKRVSRTGDEGGSGKSDDVVGETVKRWGALHGWEVVTMGTSQIRSEIVDEGGRKVLKINSDYPMYQAEKRSGRDALELYMGETAIFRLAQEVCKGKPIEEFLNVTNALVSEWGTIYQSRVKEAIVQTTRK